MYDKVIIYIHMILIVFQVKYPLKYDTILKMIIK